MKSSPLTEVTPVNTDQDLADWLGVDASDPLLSAMNLLATAAVIEFLQAELVSRARVVTYQFWPLIGTPAPVSISRQNARLNDVIELPYAKVLESVTEVTVAGELTTDYAVISAPTMSLQFGTISTTTAFGIPAIEVVYVTGYGTINDVPKQIKTATLMAADFFYNNRGSCSAEDALSKSGAASVLSPYKTKVVMI